MSTQNFNTSVFKRYVQLGRVALINYGPLQGHLCTIIDIVDQNRVLIDGPTCCTGVHRQIINLRRLDLTDFLVKVPRNARQKTLKKAWDSAEILKKWEASSWGQRIAKRAAKQNQTDFDRFTASVAKKERSSKIRAAISA